MCARSFESPRRFEVDVSRHTVRSELRDAGCFHWSLHLRLRSEDSAAVEDGEAVAGARHKPEQGAVASNSATTNSCWSELWRKSTVAR